jgi:hypothetical protein
MVIRVVIVLAAAIVGTRIFGFREQAVFLIIALGNVAGTAVLTALFLARQRTPTRSV